MEPLPPEIAALADGLRNELIANGCVETVLVHDAIAAAVRLELHLLEPAARNPNDYAWDIAHDRLLRRFLRCVDSVRYPRRRPPTPTPQRGYPRPAPTDPRPVDRQGPPSHHPTAKSTASPTQRPSNEPISTAAHTPHPRPTPPDSGSDPLPPIDAPTQPARRPGPAAVLKRSRQERRREQRQRHSSRASPA